MLTEQRIAKVIARSGLCSRREAERLIAAGKVRVDGKTIVSPALNVTGQEKIEVDGKPITMPEKTRLWLYHKPAGLLTTHRDPQGRPTVFDQLPKDMKRVISVGRLDLNSEGLLLLANDGELARHMELPATGWMRRYRVRIFGQPTDLQLDQLRKGITVEGIHYGKMEVAMEKSGRSNAWLVMGLREGKNREIRRVMEHMGYRVNRLIRRSYGPFQLGNLKSGEIKEVPGKVIREQVGRLAEKINQIS